MNPGSFAVRKHPGRSGFTLVELLVVLAITAVLIALGLGAVNGAVQKAQSLKCLDSIRQVGIAAQLYTGDQGGRLPNSSHRRAPDGSSLSWTQTLSEYLGSDFIGRCPANHTSISAVTYAWNDNLTETSGEGIPISRCRTPSSTLMLGETADYYTSEHFHFAGARSRVTYNQFKSSVGVERHRNRAHYLFADGHVESLTPPEIKNRLNAPNSPFLKP
jgi:prepilin-type N-terminal cleavage/methylation domain-containing protein/prepilin-type processing-associated H-X9-DG protein